MDNEHIFYMTMTINMTFRGVCMYIDRSIYIYLVVIQDLFSVDQLFSSLLTCSVRWWEELSGGDIASERS